MSRADRYRPPEVAQLRCHPDAVMRRHLLIRRRLPHRLAEVEHFPGDVERKVMSHTLLGIPRLHSAPSLLRGHIEPMQLSRQSGFCCETVDSLPAFFLATTGIQDARNSTQGNLRCDIPDLHETTFHALQRPGGLKRPRGIHPEQRRHPLVDGKSDSPEPMTELN